MDPLTKTIWINFGEEDPHYIKKMEAHKPPTDKYIDNRLDEDIWNVVHFVGDGCRSMKTFSLVNAI